MKKYTIMLMCLLVAYITNAQGTASIQQIVIPSTSQTLYFKTASLSDVVGGTSTLTCTGQVSTPVVETLRKRLR